MGQVTLLLPFTLPARGLTCSAGSICKEAVGKGVTGTWVLVPIPSLSGDRDKSLLRCYFLLCFKKKKRLSIMYIISCEVQSPHLQLVLPPFPDETEALGCGSSAHSSTGTHSVPRRAACPCHPALT